MNTVNLKKMYESLLSQSGRKNASISSLST